MIRSIGWFILAVGIPLGAQTQVDLHTPSKAVDLGSTPSTRLFTNWKPDVSEAGGPNTLNVSALGAIPVKLADGITDTGPGDLAGRVLEIWYDGTVLRLINAPIPAGILGEVQPRCSAAVRGLLQLWGDTAIVKGALSGAKDAPNTYARRTLY